MLRAFEIIGLVAWVGVFLLALYARRKMLQEEERPGYIPDMVFRRDGITYIADSKTEADRHVGCPVPYCDRPAGHPGDHLAAGD